MNVVGVLDHWASRQPRQPAIITTHGKRDIAISYQELRDASSRLAGALRDRRIQPGDHVALLVDLSIDLYVALIGVLWIGAVPVIVDPGAGFGRARVCFRKAEPKAIVASSRLMLLSRLLPELRHLPKVHVRKRGPAAEVEDRPENAPALLTFTSGSTGTPSAIARSHGLLMAQNAALQEVLQHRPRDRWLATLPIFVLAHLAEGVTTILADADLKRPGFINADRLARQIARCRPDAVVASPSLLARLADAQSHKCSFRAVFTGGAPVLPRTVEQLRTLSRTGDIVVVYGSSEAEPIAHQVCAPGCSWDRSLSGAGLLVGKPCDAVRVRVIRDTQSGPIGELDSQQFSKLCLPPGQAGEVVVAGPHVVKGYVDGHGDREAKIRVTASGEETIWHRTGDAARVDEEGRLWLLGRCTGRVGLQDGCTKYPFEIEVPVTQTLGIPCALLPMADGPVLVISPGTKDQATHDTGRLANLVRDGVRVISVNDLPLDKRHNAKIDYVALRRLLKQQGVS